VASGGAGVASEASSKPTVPLAASVSDAKSDLSVASAARQNQGLRSGKEIGGADAPLTDTRPDTPEEVGVAAETPAKAPLATALGVVALALGVATLVSWRARAGRGKPRSGGR
jgi:hypothetical protein